MKSMQNIVVIGAGAIGAAYAAKLYDLDPRCVTLMADEERYARYGKDGFIINGKEYRFPLALPDEPAPAADLILVAVKFHHLDQAIRLMRNRVGQETTILSLLNGISSEEIIGRTYGMEHLLYGMVVGIDAVREGNVISYTKTGSIHFGEERNGELTPRVRAVKDLFDRAGIPCEIPENMIRSLWWKFMLNVGVNQVSAVLRASYGVFQTIPEARRLMDEAMREVVRLSEARGIHLDAKDMEKAHIPISKLSPEGKTSMLQDIDAKRKTEVEMFAGTVVELGRKYGIPTPLNEILFLMIRTLERSYSLI